MRDKILIVDDTAMNRDLIGEIFESEFGILEAGDGDVALEILKEQGHTVAAVMLDLVMPKMSGYDVLEAMNRNGMIDEIPVIMISSDESSDSEKTCLKNGAFDFIHKPFDDLIVRARVNNAVKLFFYKESLEEKVMTQFEEINEKNALLEKQNAVLKKQSEKLKHNNNSIINIIGNLVESRSIESGEHVQRVRNYTKILALHMMVRFPKYKLTKKQIEIIAEASALHDIGKIAIPDNVLLKPGRLTDEEFELMKTHTTKGCEFFDEIKEIWDSRYNKISYEICRHHHERYDGRGYPDGLKGDEIPISAQIVSIADVYDALTHERCYKAAFSKDKAFNMIINGDCGTFSPELLACITAAKSELEKEE